MHRPGRGADVAQSRRMMAEEVRQPGHAPGLVHGRGGPDPVANAPEQYLGIIGEPACDVAVAPAAQILQRRGQFPVVEREGGLQAAGEHAVDETVVEVEPLGIHRAAALGHHPRPGRPRSGSCRSPHRARNRDPPPTGGNGRRRGGHPRHEPRCRGRRRNRPSGCVLRPPRRGPRSGRPRWPPRTGNRRGSRRGKRSWKAPSRLSGKAVGRRGPRGSGRPAAVGREWSPGAGHAGSLPERMIPGSSRTVVRRRRFRRKGNRGSPGDVAPSRQPGICRLRLGFPATGGQAEARDSPFGRARSLVYLVGRTR